MQQPLCHVSFGRKQADPHPHSHPQRREHDEKIFLYLEHNFLHHTRNMFLQYLKWSAKRKNNFPCWKTSVTKYCWCVQRPSSAMCQRACLLPPAVLPRHPFYPVVISRFLPITMMSLMSKAALDSSSFLLSHPCRPLAASREANISFYNSSLDDPQSRYCD